MVGAKVVGIGVGSVVGSRVVGSVVGFAVSPGNVGVRVVGWAVGSKVGKIEGAIVGKALYERRFAVAEGISALRP